MGKPVFTTEFVKRFACLSLVAALCSGCLDLFTQPQTPPLGGQVLVQPPSPNEQRAGSLWRAHANGNQPFADVTARYPGDLLTVLVTEDDSGNKTADTSTERESNILASIQQFFGLPQQLNEKNPTIDPSQLVQANSSWDYDGSGSTSRQGRLTARITVEVKAVAPTGNLWVQGNKIVSVNNEDQHVVLSGWVRPTDISARNEVESTRLADARIEYFGRGPVGRIQRPGWGLAIMDWVWPF